MKIISVILQKGGSGKSSTASTLWSGLKSKGYRVLLIDLDSQANATYISGADSNYKSSYDLMMGTSTADEVIQHTVQGDIVSADNRLSKLDMELFGTGREYRLKESLQALNGKYDYIIIDCPPALSVSTINALTVSTDALIPVQADIFSLQGIGDLYLTIETIKKYTNPGLKISGILICRYLKRSVLSRDMVEMLKDTATKIGTFVYNTVIRENVSLREAQATRQDIFTYAPKSNAAEDYKSFIDEFERMIPNE